ncbi:uncharacterized protein JCM6883_005087 [Sporobolomyces salmoneus]|uniref:uncharacterized protein n=1 Tax=Sporobolomyces salmoneus TaxID=183962 RepID=UPI00316BB7F9
MDTLPEELLIAIADSVQSDSDSFAAQTTLACLARVNKTFYAICKDRLYLDPVLGNPNMVGKWILKYSSLVTPSSSHASPQGLEHVVVPNTIRFENPDTRIVETKDTGFGPFKPRANLPPDNDFAHSTFFFRKLTSFVVSQDYLISDEFIVYLCGPSGSNRETLKHLSIESYQGCWFNSYIFEAFSRMPWTVSEPDHYGVIDLIAEDGRCSRECEIVKAHLEDADSVYSITDEDYESIERMVYELAPSNYRIFLNLSLYDDQPQAQESLSPILKSRDDPCHPFKALQSLTTHVSATFELYLIFHSQLFPVLRHLKLLGGFGCPQALNYDVKLLRRSISDCPGEILAPSICSAVIDAHPNLFESFEPLTEIEMESDPKIDYFGPNLEKLDLSECRIVEQE